MEPWTLENGVPIGEIGTLPTYSFLVRTTGSSRPKNFDELNFLFEFNRGAKGAEAARNICAVYGDNAIGESTARKWFPHFKEDRFDIVTLHVQEELRGLMKIVHAH